MTRPVRDDLGEMPIAGYSMVVADFCDLHHFPPTFLDIPVGTRFLLRLDVSQWHGEELEDHTDRTQDEPDVRC